MVLFDYNGILALKSRWLWESGLVVKKNYDTLVRRKKITVLRRSAPGCPAIISYNLPYTIKEKVDAKLKELGELPSTSHASVEGQPKPSFFETYIKPDAVAMEFFSKYDNEKLTPKKAREYYLNAIVLNAFHDLLIERKNLRDAAGINKKAAVFPTVFKDLKELDREKYPHTLPLSERNFRPMYKQYVSGGDKKYEYLLHGNDGNDNARIVTDKVEHLFLSIAAMKINPYVEWVQKMYSDFLKGTKTIFNTDTGEVYNRENFKDEHGEYLHVSDSTVWNYINKPENKVIIQKIRNEYHDFNHLYSPHTMRHAPVFSLSKVSIDDINLQRNLKDGGHVYAYKAFDVMSGAVIGSAYSRKKDAKLMLDCLRDMYRNLEKMGLGMPLEIEVENHLASDFKDTIFKPGNLFSMVRYCAPTNSQEKRAEHFRRRQKYGFEKLYQENVGRHYAKLDANRTVGERFYNEQTNEYEYKFATYSYEQIVEDDKYINKMYNASLHRDKKNHAGETLMDALRKNVNSDVWEIDKKRIYYWLGECTKTTITRNQYINLQYKKYWLPSPKILSKLKPNDYEVMAYWMYGEDNKATQEAYIFQDDRFLCEVNVMQTFSEAGAERTEADLHAIGKQMEYINDFRGFVKEGVDTKISNVRVEDIAHKEELEAVSFSETDYIVADMEEDEEINYEYEPEHVLERAMAI